MESGWEINESVRPDKLKMGRMLRAMTQRELADATGIDQALISKYENGREVPTADLKLIASTLQLPEVFFRRQSMLHAPNGASMIMFRRRQSVTGKTQDQVIMEMNRLSENARVLFDSVDVQTIATMPLYEPMDDSLEEIENIAERTRLELHVPPGPIQSLTRILESVGVIIIRRRIPAKIDALVDNMPGNPTILLISENIPGGRYRFTLAHEMGHMVMHNAINFNYEVLENQGNLFSSSFLMPAQDIRPMLRNLTMERLVALSVEWGVSVQALVHRAHDLDILSDRQYRFWNEQLSKSGYRNVEPVRIPVETPTLMNSLIQLHMNELNYSVPELAEALLMEEWEFRKNYLNESPLQLVPKPKPPKPILRTSFDDSEADN